MFKLYEHMHKSMWSYKMQTRGAKVNIQHTMSYCIYTIPNYKKDFEGETSKNVQKDFIKQNIRLRTWNKWEKWKWSFHYAMKVKSPCCEIRLVIVLCSVIHSACHLYITEEVCYLSLVSKNQVARRYFCKASFFSGWPR